MDVNTRDIRALVERPLSGPVTSVYLNTDGARFPKTSDYEARLESLLRDARRHAERLGPDTARQVDSDVEAISRWVRQDFSRDGVRGIGVFACQGEIVETVQVAVPFRNLVRVGDGPYVVPLQAMLGRSHLIGLVIIERDKARMFRYRLGFAQEYLDLASDVHGQHGQGGWSQARFSRNIEHERLHHMKDVAEVLRKTHDDEPFDALVIAGPHAEAVDFGKMLHPYLQKVLKPEPLSLPVEIGADALREEFSRVEQELVSGRRRELLARLDAAHGQAEKAARGIRHVLEAVNSKRVETLFVVEGTGSPGYRSASGALALHESEAAAYGEPVEAVDDLIDECIEECVRSGAHLEFFRDSTRLEGHTVVALLRF